MAAHVADAVGEDSAKRAVATEWLMNTVPESLPLVKQAAAEVAKTAGADSPAASRLGAILSVLRPLDKIRADHKARAQADGEWNRRTALAAYEKVGKHNPAWDAEARRGIEQLVSTNLVERAKAFATLEHVTSDLHCDDPLVLYFDARVLEVAGVRNDEQLNEVMHTYGGACERFAGSKYPADRKVMALGRMLAFIAKYRLVKQHPDWAPEVAKDADQMLSLWPELLAEKDLPFTFAYNAGMLTLDAKVAAGADRGAVLEQVLPALQKAFPNRTGVKVFQGKGLIDWAWDARGYGWASSVTPEGRRLMRERLEKAGAVLTAAYAADPSEVAVPVLMMRVGLGEGFPPAEMDLWFTRAKQADPDKWPSNYADMEDPYEARMQALQPRWGGSAGQLLAFGRQCLAGRNWRGAVPWVLSEAHEMLAEEPGAPKDYWRRPEVWRDMDQLTAGQLRVWPDDDYSRSLRAYYAWKCGQWKEADAAFKRLGDRADASPFASPAARAAAREESARKAASKAASGAAPGE